MNDLAEAQRLVEELEQDELDGPGGPGGAPGGPPDDFAVDGPPPSEPPVSDTAIDADTEGNVALQLLADIRNLLAQLVGGDESTDLPPPGEGEEGEEDAVDAIPEAPEEEEDEEGAPGARMAPPA